MMKKKKNADVVETEAAEAVTEETKTSEDKKPETETAEDIEKKAEEEAAEIEAYDAEGNPILKKKKKRKSKKKKTQKPEEVNIVKELLSHFQPSSRCNGIPAHESLQSASSLRRKNIQAPASS